MNKKLLLTLGSILLIALIGLVIGVPGGITGVINNTKSPPNPDDLAYIERRNAVKNSIEGLLGSIESSINLESYGDSTHELCYEGHNNWKRQDGFAHRCDYRLTRFFGFSGDFRKEMIELEQDFLRLGWAPRSGAELPLERVMASYYDRYYEDRSDYLVSNLPAGSAVYQNGDKHLYLGFAEQETTTLSGLEFNQKVIGVSHDTHEVQDFQDVSKVFDKVVNDHQFLFSVSIEANFFEN